MQIQPLIFIFIILLFFINYYHKQYLIKCSQKKFTYRNSHSSYDFTDYKKYKPYKEIYTYKIAQIILIFALFLDLILNKNTYFIRIILNLLVNLFIYKNWTDIAAVTIISIILYVYLYNEKNVKYKNRNTFKAIIIYLIIFFILLTLSDITYH